MINRLLARITGRGAFTRSKAGVCYVNPILLLVLAAIVVLIPAVVLLHKDAGQIPDDFLLVANFREASSKALWHVEIRSDRSALYSEESQEAEAKTLSFRITEQELLQLWRTIRHNEFFRLSPSYISAQFAEAPSRDIQVTANGKSHYVEVVGMQVERFDRVFDQVETLLPMDGA